MTSRRAPRVASAAPAPLVACRLVLALALAACVAPPPSPPPEAPRPEPPSTPTACPVTVGHALVELMNRTRAERGLPPLTVDARLARAALAHSEDLAAGGGNGHLGSDGSLPDARTRRAGYPWSYVAENVGTGWRSPAAVLDAWMRSGSHRENVLGEGRHVGVGYVERPGSVWTFYWTALYGDTPDPVRSPPGGCHP